jgi:outer membrane protein assembly factor BamB
MKRFFIISLLALVACWISCNKENLQISTNAQGQIDYLRPLWTYSLHKGDRAYSNSIVDGHLVFGDKVLVGTTEGPNNNVWLNALNVYTGQELWKWNDMYQPATEKMDISYAYEYNGIMAYTMGGRHYAIDLETGSTYWKIRRNTSFDNEIEGLGSTYFIMGQPEDTLAQYQTMVVFKGEITTGQIERILVPPITINSLTGNVIGRATSVIPFIHQGDTMLLVGWQDVLPEFLCISYLGLYNLTRRAWVYEKAPLNEPARGGVLFQPITVYQNRAYMNVGTELLCHDVWTGQLVWKARFPRDFLFSGFLVEDGKVIANCEDKVLYCLDAYNGRLLWRGEGAGTSSQLKGRYLNEVVYFSGGSSGYLHAVDSRNGKTVWKLDPTKMGDGSERWKPDLYVVPGKNGEKGRVIALTPQNAYCFEAYR